MMCVRSLLTAVLLFAAVPSFAQEPVALVLEDQFDRPADLAMLRGRVVVLVYGDRKGTEACRELGEKLHVATHPTAQGMPPAQARHAPPAPLPGLPAGKAAPDVLVVPVACCGKVPGPVKGFIRTQVAKGSPEVIVWLDFQDAMKTRFGLMPSQPNLVVIDAAGRLRLKVNGTPDAAALTKVLEMVQALRQEAISP